MDIAKARRTNVHDNAGESLREAAESVRRATAVAWGRFTDFGAGAWLAVGGVLVVGATLLSFVMGRSTPSTCDNTVEWVHQVRVYDGSRSLPVEAARNVHQDGRALALGATQTSGQQRAALLALSKVTGDAKASRSGALRLVPMASAMAGMT